MILVKLNGGLGNQMFQYAFGLRLAEQNKTELVLDLSFLQDKTHTTITLRDYALGIFPNITARVATPAELQRVAAYRTKRPYQAYNRLRKIVGITPAFALATQPSHRLFEYDPAYAQQANGHLVYVDGLWQNENFFVGSEAPVRHAFTFPPLSAPAQSLAAQIAATTAVSVHVRRGDYVQEKMASKWLTALSPQYYERAIKKLTPQVTNPTLFVFSDELDWARKVLAEVPYPVVYVEQSAADYEDMHLMSLCHHHIIANSTFSYWGAWLNPSPEKVVVVPNMYFPKINQGIFADQMVPESWLKA